MPTLDGANVYFTDGLRAQAWNTHNDDEKKAAIHDAYSMMSRLSFRVQPPTPAMDNATYEQAFCLLEVPQEVSERQQNILSGLKSFTVGKQSESYQDAGQIDSVVNGMALCPQALSWLSQYLQPKNSARSGRITTRGRQCGW